MSSTSSHDYYHSTNRGQHFRPSLPPLRSVLGDQLVLPVTHPGHQSPYDLDEISKALPPAKADHRSRATSTNVMHLDSYHRHENSHPQRSHTYPSSSSSSSAHPRYQLHSIMPAYDGYHSSRGPPHTPSTSTSKSGSSKKHVCTWDGCGKRFERQHALDTHMNIHLDQRPFACPVPYCGKVFNVRSNMRRHLLTHKDVQLDDTLGHDDDIEYDEQTAKHSQSSRQGYTSDKYDRSSGTSEYRTALQSQGYYTSTHRV